MHNHYSFVNLIGNILYDIVGELDIYWHNYDPFFGGRNMILRRGDEYFYSNSNIKEVFSIKEIKIKIENIESTVYRNSLVKKQSIYNFTLIFNELNIYERDKKISLIVK